MDPVHLVDNVPQQVARSHSVIDPFENGGNHVAAKIAVRTRQTAKISEEAAALGSVWPERFVLVDKCKKPLIEITDKFWDNLFGFVEDVAVCLLSFNFPPNVKLAVIPKKDRDPNMPKKYRVFPGFSQMQFQPPQPSQ
jgi:hypothetical protein